MPSVPQTWFQRNFGRSPWDRADSRWDGTQPDTDIYGRPVDRTVYTPYASDPQTANAVAEANRTIGSMNFSASAGGAQSQAAAQKRLTQRQAAEAAARNAVRAALMKARTQYDYSAANMPDAKAVEAARGRDRRAGYSGDYITPAGVAKDLGRSLSSADVFDTGQVQHNVQSVMDNRPRNRYEVALDGRVVGKTDTVTPIVAHPQYRDGAGEAMYYAQRKRLTASQIAQWQQFFQVTGGLSSGKFIPGAWDANTQKAMYNFMGAANSMGQKVEDLRDMAMSAAKNGGQMPWQNYSGGGGGGGGSQTTTQRIVNLTSLAKGGEILRAYLQQELGRDPDQAEIAAYVRLLNGQERKNPTIVTTTYSGGTSSSTTKEGNVDPGDTAHTVVTEQMKQELAGRRTMKYMDALMGMGG